MKLFSPFALATVICLCTGANARPDSFGNAFGPRFRGAQPINPNRSPKKALDSLHRWNEIAINASGLDHTPVASGDPRVFGEQLGPGRSSRAMAIVHIAIFDSVNALLEGYNSYTGVQAGRGPVSLDAAVAQAAHDTLSALYPSQAASFDTLLADDLTLIKNKNKKASGIDLVE